jgi:hypothetical protein
VVPVYVPEPVAPETMPAPVLLEPEVSPLIPNLPPAPQEG